MKILLDCLIEFKRGWMLQQWTIINNLFHFVILQYTRIVLSIFSDKYWLILEIWCNFCFQIFFVGIFNFIRLENVKWWLLIWLLEWVIKNVIHLIDFRWEVITLHIIIHLIDHLHLYWFFCFLNRNFATLSCRKFVFLCWKIRAHHLLLCHYWW